MKRFIVYIILLSSLSDPVSTPESLFPFTDCKREQFRKFLQQLYFKVLSLSLEARRTLSAKSVSLFCLAGSYYR